MLGNQLQKISDFDTIEALIQNTKESEKQVLGWRIVNGKKVTVELKLRVIRKSRGELIFTTRNEEDFKIFKDFAVSSESLNIYFSEDLVLFQTQIKSRDFNSKDVIVHFPKMVAHIERRKSARYAVREDSEVKVSFSKDGHTNDNFQKSFLRDCYDISTGGLSLFISRSEKKFFQENDLIKNVVVSFANRKIVGHAQVVSMFDVEPNRKNMLNYRAHKICLKFKVMSEADKKSLGDFILQSIDFEEAVS